MRASTRAFWLVFLINVVVFAAVVGLVSGQEAPAEPPHWTYEGEEGPEHWGDLDETYATCGTGEAQSPIDIAAPIEGNLVDLVQAYVPSAMNIHNNGHTIQVEYDTGSTLIYNELSYNLAQFHFHHPSEHTLNGEAFPMEIHFVHKDANGNLAVVGVMLKEGETDNAAYAALFDNLPTEKGDPNANGMTIDANTLLPENRTYFTYIGSLTTPPCSQGVRWLVMTEPVEISAAQIEKFAAIFELNARPVQPLNDRDLFADTQMGK